MSSRGKLEFIEFLLWNLPSHVDVGQGKNLPNKKFHSSHIPCPTSLLGTHAPLVEPINISWGLGKENTKAPKQCNRPKFKIMALWSLLALDGLDGPCPSKPKSSVLL